MYIAMSVMASITFLTLSSFGLLPDKIADDHYDNSEQHHPNADTINSMHETQTHILFLLPILSS